MKKRFANGACLRKAAVIATTWLGSCGIWQVGQAQSPGEVLPPPNTNTQTAPATSPTANTTANTQQPKSWIVRDPATGRVFRQQLVAVTVPVTRWEARTIEQTVYEPANAPQLVPPTTYVPQTQFVMQPRLRGWWNPFKQPTQTYQYVPVTQWVPQSVANAAQQSQATPTPHAANATQSNAAAQPAQSQWIPKKQQFVVYQQVQATEVRHQLVQTELPQPTTNSPAVIASRPAKPLFRLPILAQQRVLPWPAPTNVPTAAPATSAPPAQVFAVASQQPQVPTAAFRPASSSYPNAVASNGSSGLRPVQNPLAALPIPRFATRSYSAPLQPTVSSYSSGGRDALQAGMQPTVLR